MRIKYYHATDHKVDKPDVKEHRRNIRSIINGNSVLGLFANTNPQGSEVYGENLYSFKLREAAKVLEIDDEFRQAGRCAEYYRGIRDLLLDMGYHAIKVSYEFGEFDGISLVVLDFDMIVNWNFEGCSSDLE